MDGNTNPYKSPQPLDDASDAELIQLKDLSRSQVVTGMWLGSFFGVLFGAAFYPASLRYFPDDSIPAGVWIGLAALSLCSLASSAIGAFLAVKLIRRRNLADMAGGTLCLLTGGWMPIIWVPIWWVRNVTSYLS